MEGGGDGGGGNLAFDQRPIQKKTEVLLVDLSTESRDRHRPGTVGLLARM